MCNLTECLCNLVIFILVYKSLNLFCKNLNFSRGLGGTPFFPPNVNIPAPHGVHMVEFFGTDYIANSMLYHAYRQRYMDVIVGPESSPQLKGLF
jgi:hypothetical protein